MLIKFLLKEQKCCNTATTTIKTDLHCVCIGFISPQPNVQDNNLSQKSRCFLFGGIQGLCTALVTFILSALWIQYLVRTPWVLFSATLAGSCSLWPGAGVVRCSTTFTECFGPQPQHSLVGGVEVSGQLNAHLLLASSFPTPAYSISNTRVFCLIPHPAKHLVVVLLIQTQSWQQMPCWQGWKAPAPDLH